MKKILDALLRIFKPGDSRGFQFVCLTHKYIIHLQKLYNSCTTLNQVYNLYYNSNYVKQLVNQIRCLGERNDVSFSVVEERVDMLMNLECTLYELSIKRIKEQQNDD